MFINSAIEQELRLYFTTRDGYEQITIDDEDVLKHCVITEEELSLVDKDALSKLFTPRHGNFSTRLLHPLYLCRRRSIYKRQAHNEGGIC